MCGALSGAIMGVGLLDGREEPGKPVEDIYTRIQSMVNRFENDFGSINCQELTNCHLGTEGGQALFRATNQIEKCLIYVEDATRMTLE